MRGYIFTGGVDYTRIGARYLPIRGGSPSSLAFPHLSFGVLERLAIYATVRGADAAGNETAVSAHVYRMDTKKNHPLPLSKIDQLVEDAKTELKRVGIQTEGKRSDEILKMARDERNKPRGA